MSVTSRPSGTCIYRFHCLAKRKFKRQNCRATLSARRTSFAHPIFDAFFFNRISVKTGNELPEDTCIYVQVQFHRTRWLCARNIFAYKNFSFNLTNNFPSLTTQFHMNSFRRYGGPGTRFTFEIVIISRRRQADESIFSSNSP